LQSEIAGVLSAGRSLFKHPLLAKHSESQGSKLFLDTVAAMLLSAGAVSRRETGVQLVEEKKQLHRYN
jgi:hypothetical protein